MVTYDEWKWRDEMADDEDQRGLYSEEELQRHYEDDCARLQQQATTLARYYGRVRDYAEPYRAIVYDTHWEPYDGAECGVIDVRGLPETEVIG